MHRTGELAQIILEAVQAETHDKGWRLHPAPDRWQTHPAARTFQVLRILVNRELANLDRLLAVLPDCLKPGGVAAIMRSVDALLVCREKMRARGVARARLIATAACRAAESCVNG